MEKKKRKTRKLLWIIGFKKIKIFGRTIRIPNKKFLIKYLVPEDVDATAKRVRKVGRSL